MRGLRRHFSYANVMATIAVFIALGGGAYALSRGEVKSKNIARDAVKAKHIGFGVRSVPMMASVQDLSVGTGSTVFSVVGADVAGAPIPKTVAPQTLIARDLVVQLSQDDPLAAGSRSFFLQVDGGVTPLSCTIAAGERSCRSGAGVRLRRGQSMYFGESHNGTNDGQNAQVGWRAVLP